VLHHRVPRLLTLVVAAGVLVSACAGTGYNYVKNSEDRTYFKVPDSWKVYDEDEVFDLTTKGLNDDEKEVARDLFWAVRFDGSPRPSIEHLTGPYKHPTGLAEVQDLLQEESDAMSLSTLRNLYFPIDEAEIAGDGAVLAYEPIELDGGFHGVHIVGRLVIDEKGTEVTFSQNAVLDQATSKLYAFIVFCRSDCYSDNEEQIDRIVDSWTVRE
jgi:hypothetical protein